MRGGTEEVDIMNLAQTILLGILASNALFTFIQFLITRHDQRKDSPVKQALLALCSERLESLLHKWLSGDVDHTVARWAAINNLFKAYESLGGNGEIRALYDIAKDIKPTE